MNPNATTQLAFSQLENDLVTCKQIAARLFPGDDSVETICDLYRLYAAQRDKLVVRAIRNPGGVHR